MKALVSFTLLTVFVGNALIAPIASAQGQNPPGGQFTQGLKKAKDFAANAGLSKKTDVFDVIATIIKFLLALSAVLALGAIVWGGIMYITSLGDEGRAGKAKQIIWYAIIGVTIVLISYVIIAFIQTQLAAVENPLNISTVYAASASDKGFKEGLFQIEQKILPNSGLATGNSILPKILAFINLLLSLVAVLALAAMVWGAVMYILSLGDEGRAEKAKKIILNAIIGVVLAGVSFLIISVLQRLLTT